MSLSGHADNPLSQTKEFNKVVKKVEAKLISGSGHLSRHLTLSKQRSSSHGISNSGLTTARTLYPTIAPQRGELPLIKCIGNSNYQRFFLLNNNITHLCRPGHCQYNHIRFHW